ncbi:unnamed protein product [Rotaria sordida]|uniref:G-protein coupled receptors family 1 profile domain-containing protein n=1 Tax=Rotaria sordida TaxID=392033 RepID=A0A819IH51_9BILA|nr:unnamed protein product [Rotaria sordida]
MIAAWLIAGFHLPVFMDIRNSVCGLYDFYKLFYAIYQIVLVGILPPLLMSSFGFLTIHSLHQRHGDQTHVRRKDRDLMRMLIAEIIVNIFTSIPYSANLVYGAATYYVVDKSVQRLEIESFITFFSQFLIHTLSVAPFYLFIIASKSFRHELISTMVKWWYKYILRQEQLNTLKNELFQFLNRQEQTINNQIIRISNEEECLLCLSKLATLILERLFDGDLNDTKTEFFYH